MNAQHETIKQELRDLADAHDAKIAFVYVYDTNKHRDTMGEHWGFAQTIRCGYHDTGSFSVVITDYDYKHGVWIARDHITLTEHSLTLAQDILTSERARVAQIYADAPQSTQTSETQ